MLGCHEFCGYYEWTFHYVRRRWGQAAVERLWAEAIGGESQRHYSKAAQEAGLAGLYRTWVKTGQDESCDWTFTLDEARNVLRWDMRQCPSKGFLIAHDLNADEDYCDHCMGWMIPLLEQVGVEVWEHEHNHCGQCWGTMRQNDRPSHPLDLDGDIRHDPPWNRGYLDRWAYNRKQPLLGSVSDSPDPCDVLAAWFARADRLVVVPKETSIDRLPDEFRGTAGVMTDRTYASRGDLGLEPLGVLIGHAGPDLEALAKRFRETDDGHRPLLLHAYFPGCSGFDFLAHGLPRPLPILPLLIRTGKYVHKPGGSCPTPVALLMSLAEALERPAIVAG
jgi:hypothetical protein